MPSPSPFVLQPKHVYLQVMRAITARDDGGAALADGLDLVSTMTDDGVPQMLLAMLARLAPIQPSGGRPRPADDARGPPIPQPGIATETAPGDAQWPAQMPFRGYRGDVVAGALHRWLCVLHSKPTHFTPMARSSRLEWQASSLHAQVVMWVHIVVCQCLTYGVGAAVLANMAHRRPAVQREIRRLGGVELLLSQCQASC